MARSEHVVSAESVEGLDSFLKEIGLESRYEDVDRWCQEFGAAFVEEVVESVKDGDLGDWLGLDKEEANRVILKAREWQPKGVQDFDTNDTIKEDVPTNLPGMGARRMSHTMRSATKTRLDDMGGMGDPKAPSAGPPRTMSITCCKEGGMARTLTVEGPLAGVFGSLPVSELTMEIAAVKRTGLGERLITVSKAVQEEEQTTKPDGLAPLPQSTPASGGYAQPESKTKAKISRVSTVNDMGGSQREDLVQKVKAPGRMKTKPMDEGQTGDVYALESGGDRVAVFKPTSGEKFRRLGLSPGQGAVREEAAYLVDRLCGSQAGIPVTSRATIEVDGEAVEGAVQAFVQGAIGYIEDYAMPRDSAKASEFVLQEQCEALALLDMRILNTDRHGGNLLVLKESKPHGLGPIDHGCCLPPWWSLSEALFQAWQDWPQFKGSPSQFAKRTAELAKEKLDATVDALRRADLDEPAIITLQLCTTLVHAAICDHGMPIARLAQLILRSEESFEEPSWFEERVISCAKEAGAKCSWETDDRGDKVAKVEDNGEGLSPEKLLSGMADLLKKELPSIAAQALTD